MSDSYNRAVARVREMALLRMGEARPAATQFELGTLGSCSPMRRYFVDPDRRVTRVVWRADLDEEAMRGVTVPHIYDFEPTIETAHGLADQAFIDQFSPLTLPSLRPDMRLLLDGESYDFVAMNFSIQWNSAQHELVDWFHLLETQLSAFLP